MEHITQPPFASAPPPVVDPASQPTPKSTFVKVVVWIAASAVWLAGVGMSWLMAMVYAADEWGGGWLFGSGVTEPFYDDVVLAINVAGILIGLVPVVWFGVWSYRRN